MALTGFLHSGNCFATSVEALNGFAAEFPQLSGSVPFLVSYSGGTFTAPNTFNLTLKVHSLIGAPEYLLNHLISVPLCDPALSIAGVGTVFDPVLAGAAWMFAITMVLGVWVLAKNAGIIINMVRRW